MGIIERSPNGCHVTIARDILDLYVGSLADFDVGQTASNYRWQTLRQVSQAQLRNAAEPSFEHADTMERTALDRILTSFLTHRDSNLEHSWMVSDQDTPIGLCLISQRHYYSSEKRAPYVDLVAVSPAYRHQGLASQLLTRSALSLWDAGFRTVIHAHIRRGNTASERLFRKHSFLLWLQDC